MAPLVLYLHVVVLLQLWTTGYALDAGESCGTPDDRSGRCVPVDSCDVYRDMLYKKVLSPNAVKFLRQTQCDLKSENAKGSCRTPDGKVGECISIDFCDSYRDMLNQRPLSPDTVNFLRRAQCGFQGHRISVCCSDSASAQSADAESGRPPPAAQGVAGPGGSTPTATPTGGGGATDVANHPNWRLLPSDDCGSDVNDRIFDGYEASLMEYPWLALLRYRIQTGLRFLCGGSLINNRYVLTAAHCVKRTDNIKLVAVRLGENNIDTDPDCTSSPVQTECGDPVEDINIDDVIVHPGYRSDSRDHHHDIALLRLGREVIFTDYKLPICVPNGAILSKSYEDSLVVMAGWGIKGENGSASNVKLWVRIPVISKPRCAPIYQRHLSLHANQMCAGGVEGKDSCRGDSGGPLMKYDALEGDLPRWFAAGIASIRPSVCATRGRPEIYTRVAPYVGWILDTLKP